MDCGRLGSEIAPNGPLRVPLVMKAPRMASHSRYEKTDARRVRPCTDKARCHATAKDEGSTIQSGGRGCAARSHSQQSG